MRATVGATKLFALQTLEIRLYSSKSTTEASFVDVCPRNPWARCDGKAGLDRFALGKDRGRHVERQAASPRPRSLPEEQCLVS